MKKTQIKIDSDSFPMLFHSILSGAAVYDSSCSPTAKVYFIDKDEGFYLKTAAKGELETEAKLTRFFYQNGLASEVLAYEQADRDWLLTRRIVGEDCTHSRYLNDPKRLCDTTAVLLRTLHESSSADCPVRNRTQDYLDTVFRNYRAGNYDLSILPDNQSCKNVHDAWHTVQEYASCLKTDTLLHGDYCLPNIILNDWNFSAFVDLGCGGVGDRHIDLFWGEWSLNFNLKTNAYYDRFLDVYGRDLIEPEILNAIAAFEVFG